MPRRLLSHASTDYFALFKLFDLLYELGEHFGLVDDAGRGDDSAEVGKRSVCLREFCASKAVSDSIAGSG